MREFRIGGFQILPTVIKNLIIINVLVLLAQNVFKNIPGFSIEDLFALHTFQSALYRPWQFVTYMFLHGGISHLFGNMFALWMFGSVLEGMWGPKRFLTFYIICGVGAAMLHMGALYYETYMMEQAYTNLLNTRGDITSGALNFVKNYGHGIMASPHAIFEYRLNEATLGASGAVFGCLAAFGFLFPNDYLYLYFFFPVKVKWFVIGYIVVELSMTIQNSAGDNVAHLAHLGGAIFGFLLAWFWRRDNPGRRRNFH